MIHGLRRCRAPGTLGRVYVRVGSSNRQVDFDAVNLTNSLAQTYYAFGSAGGPNTDNFGTSIIGRSYEVGVRWKL